MDHYSVNNRSMAITAEVSNGHLSSRFETVETSLLREPGVIYACGADRQVYEKRSLKGETEGRCSRAHLEHDCYAYGSRTPPHCERSR